jgi:hypothetical protein
MVGAFLAERGIVAPAHRGGEPHPAFPVDHHIVIVDARIPDLPVAPIGRRHRRLFGRGVPGTKRSGSEFVRRSR